MKEIKCCLHVPLPEGVNEKDVVQVTAKDIGSSLVLGVCEND